MIDAFVFWIMKGVAELVAVFALLSVFVVLAIIADIKKRIPEQRGSEARRPGVASITFSGTAYAPQSRLSCGSLAAQ